MMAEECKHGLDPAWCSLCKAPKPPSTQGAAPAAVFVQTHPKLFHVTAQENVEGIRQRGLRTAAQLAEEACVQLAGVRRQVIRTAHAIIRDQRPMGRGALLEHLDGVTLDQWVAILNERVFLFPQEARARALAQTYAKQSLPQAILRFDTRSLLAAAGNRLEVADRNTGSLPRIKGCPCRGRSTFVPLARVAAHRIQEVTVVGGLARDDATWELLVPIC